MPNIEDILANLDPTRPILKRTKVPFFKREEDKNKYWGKEFEKYATGIKNDYGLFIPGSLYMMSQLGTIVNRRSGAEIELIIRDYDYIIHHNMWTSRQEGKWDMYIKARNGGFTVEGGGQIPMYFGLMYAGCSINMTSCDQKRLATMYNISLLPNYNGLHPDIKPDTVKTSNNASDVGITMAVNTVENGSNKVKFSRIMCKPTAHSDLAASGFSGSGSMYTYLDEFFLNPRAEKITHAAIDTSRDKQTGKLEGYCIAGGTMENSISPDQLREFQKLWEKAENSHIWNRTFLPDYLGSHMTNGHSSLEKANEKWEREAEGYLKVNDMEGYTAYRKNHPRTLDDIFDFVVSDKWEADISAAIKIQHGRTVIDQKNGINTWTPHDVALLNGNVEAVPTSKSATTIMEQPKPNIRYWICVDGTGTGKETGNADGSAFSATVVKGYDPSGGSWSVVALYNERPKTLEEAFYKILYLALHYNKHNGLVCIAPEANNLIDYYSTWMTKQGYLHFVMLRKDLSGNGNSKQDRYGQPRTKETIAYQYKWANSFLRKYIGSISCIPLLEDMLKRFEENTDVLDSWLMLGIALPPDFDKEVIKKKEVRRMEFYNEKGKTGWRVIDPSKQRKQITT